LTFLLGEDKYAVHILQVQEIRSYAEPTPLANMPPHVKGVLHLRGAVIPIVDLRARFGLPEGAPVQRRALIIVLVGGTQVGLIVDAVADVMVIPTEARKPAPEVGIPVDKRLIYGVATVEGRLILLPAIDKILLPEQVAALVTD
jgi:purine-binding chemotaxis protein CheW